MRPKVGAKQSARTGCRSGARRRSIRGAAWSLSCSWQPSEDVVDALDGAVVIRPMMYVALSYDHRIIDGSTAVRFLVRIKELVEDSEALLLEG